MYTKCLHCKHFKKLANLTRKKVTQFEDFNVPLNQNNITNSFFVHLKSCLLDFPKHLYFQDITKLQNCLHPTFLPVPVHDHHFSVSLYFFIFHTLLSNKKNEINLECWRKNLLWNTSVRESDNQELKTICEFKKKVDCVFNCLKVLKIVFGSEHELFDKRGEFLRRRGICTICWFCIHCFALYRNKRGLLPT